MRKVLLALAASVAVASPALANEARVEARGGVIWDSGTSEATAGVAAGYDFDLGGNAFFGAEVSADKVLVSGSDVYYGLTGRAGIKTGENGKLFVAGGYTVGEGEDVPHLGAGYEHKLGSNLYLKGEYRHFFSDFSDADAVSAGIGFKF
jgi:hypothetical protein